MKVAHITDCYLPRLGGIEVQVHDLAFRQRGAGHDVHVITATPPARHDRTAFHVLDGIPVHRVTVDLPFELPVHPRAGREVGRLLAAAGYDAIHVHTGLVSPFTYPAARTVCRAGLPMVVTVHSLWGPAAAAIFRLIDGPIGWTRWPAVLSAVSEVAASPLRRIAGPGVDVQVLPNGVDASQWRVEPQPRDPAEVHLVAVMRLTARKRPLPLLRMLREIRNRTPSRVRLRATVIGDGPARAAMLRYLDRHQLAGWVTLPGRAVRDQIVEVFRDADVFLAPANLESFGMAAMEARCAGLPVVAMARTGIREFISPEVEGLLAATDDEMVAATVRLCTSPGLRARIADHNRTVSPTLTWTDVLQRCEAAYLKAAALV